MKKCVTLLLMGLLAVAAAAQDKQVRHERRPPELPASSVQNQDSQKQPDYAYFSILNGLPVLFELHHDTEVGTNKPVDVYLFVIEMQVMNSDGNLEPIGLQIFNYFTARAQNWSTAPSPFSARDCGIWNRLVKQQIKQRSSTSPTWPYVEFTVAKGARTLQTNEDGQVFWSDDVECWGASDRFPPF